MSARHSPLITLVLGVVRTRMNLTLESASERFRTIVAAQPADTKRQKVTDEQLAEFVSDLATDVPEVSADEINAARQDANRPSTAEISALRVLLDLKPRDVPDHPGPTITLPVQHPAGLTAWFAVMDLADFRRQGWTLVGGQMVHLLAWEHGEKSPGSPRTPTSSSMCGLTRQHCATSPRSSWNKGSPKTG